MKERIKKGAAIMGQVWEIEKKRFRDDWRKRIWLYNAVVWSVLGYRVEIWSWEEREEIEG